MCHTYDAYVKLINLCQVPLSASNRPHDKNSGASRRSNASTKQSLSQARRYAVRNVFNLRAISSHAQGWRLAKGGQIWGEGSLLTKLSIQAEMTSVSLLPLLERLAGESDELLRRSLLTAASAIAQAGISDEMMPTIVREAWAEKVLSHEPPFCCRLAHTEPTLLICSHALLTCNCMIASDTQLSTLRGPRVWEEQSLYGKP